MPPEQYWVTDLVASHWTGRPRKTIRKWGHEGRLTKHIVGPHRVRYDLRELQPWTAANGPMATPPLPGHTLAA